MMKIELTGTPEELRIFLGENFNTNGLNVTINTIEETQEVLKVIKDRNLLQPMGNMEKVLELLKDVNLPGVNLENFKYDSDRDTGYFGRLNSDDFISYVSLSKKVRFSKGTVMPDKGWLVFYYRGEIVYIPQHPIRYNMSWDDLESAGLVFGKDIKIDKQTYNISLPTGAKANPVDDIKWQNSNANEELEIDLGYGSVWNELIYRVHKDIPGVTDLGEDCSGGPQYGENWDELTDEELNINWNKCSVGTATWCQEIASTDSAGRVHRGHHRLAISGRGTSSDSYVHLGWRAMLKVKIDSREA